MRACVSERPLTCLCAPSICHLNICPASCPAHGRGTLISDARPPGWVHAQQFRGLVTSRPNCGEKKPTTNKQQQHQQRQQEAARARSSSDLISSITGRRERAPPRARTHTSIPRRARTRNHLSTRRDKGAWRRTEKTRTCEHGRTGAPGRLTRTDSRCARTPRGGTYPESRQVYLVQTPRRRVARHGSLASCGTQDGSVLNHHRPRAAAGTSALLTLLWKRRNPPSLPPKITPTPEILPQVRRNGRARAQKGGDVRAAPGAT